MKRLTELLLFLFVIIAVSCKSDGVSQIIEADRINLQQSSIQDRYKISSTSLIHIEGLEKDELYAIFPEGKTGKSRAGKNFISTNSGTFLTIADGKELQLTGSDLSLEDGFFRITKLETETGAAVIDENTDTPLFIDSEGRRVYEKKYSVNPADEEGLNTEATTLLAILNGSGTLSSDYGIITPEGKKESGKHLMDLSSTDNLTIYSQLHITESRKPISYEIRLVSPVRIEKNMPFTLSSPTVYMVEPDNEELVFEIDMQDKNFSDYSIANAVPDGRYADTGLRKQYIFPITVKNGKLIIYIGRVEKNIIFNFISGTGSAVLRNITEEEKDSILIHNANSPSLDITIPAGNDQLIIPFLFTGKQTGRTVNLNGDIPDVATISIVAGSTDGNGYSEQALKKGQTTVTFSDYRELEYGFVKISGEREESTITLTFS